MEGAGPYCCTRICRLSEGSTPPTSWGRRVVQAHSRRRLLQTHQGGFPLCQRIVMTNLRWAQEHNNRAARYNDQELGFYSILNLNAVPRPRWSKVAVHRRLRLTFGDISIFRPHVNKPWCFASLRPFLAFLFSRSPPLSTADPSRDSDIVSPACCSAPANNTRPTPILLRHPATNAHPVHVYAPRPRPETRSSRPSSTSISLQQTRRPLIRPRLRPLFRP